MLNDGFIPSIKISKMQFVAYLLLCVCFYFISIHMRAFTFSIQPKKILISFSLVVFFIHLSTKIKDQFIYFIYQIAFILIFLGEAVYYQFNITGRFECVLGSGLFLAMLVATQKINFKLRKIASSKLERYLLPVIVLLLFVPYALENIKNINLNNLLLKEIYDTRETFREIDSGRSLMGYAVPILSRIVLPFLICEAAKKRRYIMVAVYSLMILFLFLCGALKSVLFGLAAVIVFYTGSYEKKVLRFTVAISLVYAVGILFCLGNNTTIIDYIRRVFFTPAALENVYVNYFDGKFTYMAHSRLTFGLLGNPYGSSLSMYVGERLIGNEGLNANIGAIMEGYVSFGIIGIFLSAFFFAILFQFFKSEGTSVCYAGIFFVYLYVMNTAFIQNLLAGHGLLFLILFSYLFMRQKENNDSILAISI